MHVHRPYQFQLRLGWLRVAAALLTRDTLAPSALAEGLLSFREAQDAWLGTVGAPTGRVSPRATNELVRMADAYDVYDRDAGTLGKMGLVLASLDDWSPGGAGNPMVWSPPLSLLGLRLCVLANGAVIIPLLTGWRDQDDLVTRLTTIYQELRDRPGGSADEAIASALDRLSKTGAWEQVVRPVLEPLRDLDLVSVDGRSYGLTGAGRRLSAALRTVPDSTTLLDDHLVAAWAAAASIELAPAAPGDLARMVPQLLASLPPLLRGQAATSAPMATLGPWLQVRCAAASPPLRLEVSDLDRWIRSVIKRSDGRVYLRSGMLVGQSDLYWAEDALSDPALWFEGPPPASPPRPSAPEALATASEAAPGGSDGEPPSPVVRGWHAWVQGLLRVDEGTAHGGPETWLRHLRGELELISPERMARRRKESAYLQDFDNSPSNEHFRQIGWASLKEVRWVMGQAPEAEDLLALLRHAPNEGRREALDQGLILLAKDRLPALRRAVVDRILDFLQGGKAHFKSDAHADRADKAFRLTRWLVEDARFCRGWSTEQLTQDLGAAPSLAGARLFLTRLSGEEDRQWSATFTLSPTGAAVDAARVLEILDRVDPPLAKRARAARETFGVASSMREELSWEGTVTARSQQVAEAKARGDLDRVVSTVDFALAVGRDQAGSRDAVGLKGRVEVVASGLDEPAGTRVAIDEPDPEMSPRYWGFCAPDLLDRLAGDQPAEVSRTLLSLHALTGPDGEEDRPARRVAQLWAAVEHLVVGPDDVKGPGVIRVLSAAAALLQVPAAVGVVMRRALAALHRRTFDLDHQEAALEQWERWLGPEEHARYEQVGGKVLAQRDKFFGASGLLEISDNEALRILAERAAEEGGEASIVALAQIVAVDDPWASWQLGILGHRVGSAEALRRTFRVTRVEVAGLLTTAYDVRNRLLHAGDVGPRDSDPMLSALYSRLRRVLDLVVLALLHRRFRGTPMRVRWAVMETLAARLVGREKDAKDTDAKDKDLPYPLPFLDSCLLLD